MMFLALVTVQLLAKFFIGLEGEHGSILSIDARDFVVPVLRIC